MRRLRNLCSSIQSRSRAAFRGVTLRRIGSFLAAGGVVFASSAMAQDDTKPVQKANSETKTPHATHAEAAIPECMEKLNLTEPQQTKAKEIISDYDAKLAMVWKQFGEKYMATVRTECMLLAAIEDGLTESQRTAVHAQRRQVAHAEKALEGKGTKLNKATEKPVDAVDQLTETAGGTLTHEQEASADKIQQNYASQLRSQHRDIEGLHNRLVSLEADKLVELEKVLTKAQLTQLREYRQMTATAPKVTTAEKVPRIAE